MIPIIRRASARTRTIRDIAAHRRRTLESERDMPALFDGACFALKIVDVTMLDMVVNSARWLGGADATIATWAVSSGAIEHLATAKAIKSIVWLLDRSQAARKSKGKEMEAAASCGTVHIVNSHMKVTVLHGESQSIVLAGSANLTTSRGAEFMMLDVDRDYANSIHAMLMEMVP